MFLRCYPASPQFPLTAFLCAQLINGDTSYANDVKWDQVNEEYERALTAFVTALKNDDKVKVHLDVAAEDTRGIAVSEVSASVQSCMLSDLRDLRL